MPLIALTGGPGAGKTAVISDLRSRGYPSVPDSARAIIQERVSKGLEPRPAPSEFAEQILSLDAEQYQRMADASGPVFFDRGVVDALGMVHQLGLVSAAELRARLASYPYFRTAFCFPPWGRSIRRMLNAITRLPTRSPCTETLLLGTQGADTIWSRCRA